MCWYLCFILIFLYGLNVIQAFILIFLLDFLK